MERIKHDVLSVSKTAAKHRYVQINHLTPNGHYSARAEIPKLGGILFTPVGLTAVVCLSILTLEGLVFILEPEYTPSTP
jgi:hypothetical protein